MTRDREKDERGVLKPGGNDLKGIVGKRRISTIY